MADGIIATAARQESDLEMTTQAETVPPRTVLHVGCGSPNPRKLHPTFRGGAWKEVRLDIDPAVRPDIVCDMLDMSVVATGSVDAVWYLFTG